MQEGFLFPIVYLFLMQLSRHAVVEIDEIVHLAVAHGSEPRGQFAFGEQTHGLAEQGHGPEDLADEMKTGQSQQQQGQFGEEQPPALIGEKLETGDGHGQQHAGQVEVEAGL